MKVFAAIYIGSYEASLKIFEIAAKKGAREIDHVRAVLKGESGNWQRILSERLYRP